MSQQPTLKVKEVSKILSKELGIGLNTIQSTIADYKNLNTVRSPNKSKFRPSFKEKVNGFKYNMIRRKVYDFWFKR